MHEERGSEFADQAERQAPAQPLSRRDFASTLHRTLRHYPRLETLEDNPLLDTRIVAARLRRAESPETPAQALRESIREQCQSWANAPKTAVLERVLRLTYLDPMRSQQAVADTLNMSWSTYRRRLAEARELLTTQLWQTEQLLAAEPARKPEAKEERKATRPRGRRARFAATGAVGILIVAGLLVWHFGPWHAANGAQAAMPSIAVLPFENLSTNPDNAYFAAGIQDEILTRLASIGSLKVISRTSTARYPSRPADLPTIARQLGVTTVLEGSVQRSGDEVHVNVQLIDARTQAHIWAHSYNRKLADVFGVEGEVAQEIANALSAELMPQEVRRLNHAPTENQQAYLLFLKANYQARQIIDESNAKHPRATIARGISLYKQAISHDPQFALAWARLSRLQSANYWFYNHTPNVIAAATHSAKKALELDPKLPQAHLAMGFVEYHGQRNYAAALAQFRQAQRSLPNSANVIYAIAAVHRRRGEWKLALTDFRKAAALDVRNPRRHYEIGATLAALRRYSEADAQFKQALAIQPDDYVAMGYRAWVLLLAGNLKQARIVLSKIPPDVGPPEFIRTLRYKIALLERKPERALAVLDGASTWSTGTTLPYDVPTSLLRARVFWFLQGNKPRALKAYEKARAMLQSRIHKRVSLPDSWSALGLVEAGLGNKKKALHAGIRATQILPLSKDAFLAPYNLTVLAMIYAQLNEPASAVKLLHRLLSIPAGAAISVPLLRLDSTWDPIRHDPRFQALLKQYGQSAPASTQRLPSEATANRHGAGMLWN